MKAIRYVLIAIVALVVLAAAAIAIAMAVIDPNDYKPQIEKVVEEKTNLDLILEGDIGWSFIPLGLELNDVEATLEGERLVALKQLVAQVDLWSLVVMSPQVDTFVLDGLDARLSINEKGEGNWTRIMPEPADGDAQKGEQDVASNSEETPATEGEGEQGGEALNFNVDKVQISNAQVHYSDQRTGQTVTLEDFTVNANNITLGSEFPLEIGFRVETTQPTFEVDGSIEARLAANEALNNFAISGLEAVFKMNGEPFGGKSVTAKLGGSAKANLENETATLSDFTASLANLTLNTNLDVKSFGDKPTLKGKVAISEFSLKDLLENMGQPAIETSDEAVLEAIAFSTNIGGAAGKPALSDLVITLDDTTFKGSGSYNLDNGGIVFDLQGDKLNADRYLPPKAEGESEGEEAESDAPTKTADTGPEGDLLPLDVLRSLILDIDFGLGELIVSNLTINEIKASTTASKGVLKVDEFSGKLYEGSFGADVTIDASTDTPKWSVNSDVTNVQTLPLLADLAEVTMLSGGANLKVNATTSGNRMSLLSENADGQISFNLAKGEFRKMNLTQMACQGIALVNQDKLTTDNWGDVTPFDDMHGVLDINGNTLDNTDLTASMAGMKLEGNGTVDLKQTLVDYELGLRIVGDIHRDNACRVTEYVEDVVIPVECRGDFAADAAGLCSFDGSRFRDALKTIASNAAKKKAKKEVDKAKGKAEEKVREKLEETLGKDDGDKLKDAIKGLFE
ncbi:MAG: AsmA family protein [Marinobacter sp.]